MVLEIALTTLLTKIALKGAEQIFESSIDKITTDSIDWFKSLFYKNGKPKKVMEELQKDPTNEEKLSNAKAIILNSIEDNPEFENYLKEIIEKLPEVGNVITNSKNVNTGNVDTGGGDFRIGDNYGN
ncbi:MAG: hypothetical protein WA897_02925 [Moheibacter sp.]